MVYKNDLNLFSGGRYQCATVLAYEDDAAGARGGLQILRGSGACRGGSGSGQEEVTQKLTILWIVDYTAGEMQHIVNYIFLEWRDIQRCTLFGVW